MTRLEVCAEFNRFRFRSSHSAGFSFRFAAYLLRRSKSSAQPSVVPTWGVSSVEKALIVNEQMDCISIVNSPRRDPSMLLHPDEPTGTEIIGNFSNSMFLFVCDHAGIRIPKSLGNLGISKDQLERHIGWDIGAAGVTRELSALLDAPAVLQTYSRLVIDCNRPTNAPESIIKVSEDTPIPGNFSLSDEHVVSRIDEIFVPYHRAITDQLDTRRARGRVTVLVAVHSFTPIFKGNSRPWHIGVMYNKDPRFAHSVRNLLQADSSLVVGDNRPYCVSETGDYTIPVHGEQRFIPHVALEIRHDLIREAADQKLWAQRLAEILTAACGEFDRREAPDQAVVTQPQRVRAI